MLCWLRDDEMSAQELLQRLQSVIAHVGESFTASLFHFGENIFELIEPWQEAQRMRESSPHQDHADAVHRPFA